MTYSIIDINKILEDMNIVRTYIEKGQWRNAKRWISRLESMVIHSNGKSPRLKQQFEFYRDHIQQQKQMRYT